MNAQVPAPARPTPPQRVNINWPELNARNHPLKGSMMNVRAALLALKVDCSYDAFLGRYFVAGRALDEGNGGEVSERMTRAARETIFKCTRYEPGVQAARDGLMRACEAHSFNSLQDYLNGLAWDGVPRLDTWLTTYLGVADSELHREWGKLTLFAACRRAFEPGCKWDHVLSLEGLEGANKSTVCKVLAGATDLEGRCEYFSDSTILDKEEKEQMELTRGIWIYELSEMSGASRADQKKLKAFVVRQEDRAREAYAYFKTNQPRSSIFIATVNTDPNTGETVPYLNPGDRRRWWPVVVAVLHPIDIDGLLRDRDQLFAEAMARVRVPVHDALTCDLTGHEWHSLKLPPKFFKLAEAEQVEREIEDPLVDRLSTLYTELTCELGRNEARTVDGKSIQNGRDYLVRPAERGFSGDVWVSSKFLQSLFPPSFTNDGRRVAAAMAKLGWRTVRDRRSGLVARGYVHRLEKPTRSPPVVPSVEPCARGRDDADVFPWDAP